MGVRVKKSVVGFGLLREQQRSDVGPISSNDRKQKVAWETSIKLLLGRKIHHLRVPNHDYEEVIHFAGLGLGVDLPSPPYSCHWYEPTWVFFPRSII